MCAEDEGDVPVTLIVIAVLLLLVVPALIFLIAKIVTNNGKRRLPLVSYPQDLPQAPKTDDPA